MIQVPSVPPSTTFADIGAGAGFIVGAGNVAHIKTDGAVFPAINAVRLLDGVGVSFAVAQVITSAPAAQFTMFP